jgi:hypothetical protein
MPYSYQSHTIAVLRGSQVPSRPSWRDGARYTGHRIVPRHRGRYNICLMWSRRRLAVVRELSHPYGNLSAHQVRGTMHTPTGLSRNVLICFPRR